MASPELRVDAFHGEAARPQLETLAALRMRVFAEWPYLYDGSLAYEAAYLERYLAEPRSIIVLAWEGDTAVGVTTALPMEAAEPEMQQAWRADGAPLEDVLYFGESVVLPAYRGLGLGRRFFALREAHAREQGRGRCCFCAVQRPDDHSARPIEYVPNDAFWQRLGYRRRDDKRCWFGWTDIGDAEETQKPLVFWEKTLG